MHACTLTTTRLPHPQEESFCKASRTGQECILKKKHPFPFDRLLADPKELPFNPKIDWDNWKVQRSGGAVGV